MSAILGFPIAFVAGILLLFWQKVIAPWLYTSIKLIYDNFASFPDGKTIFSYFDGLEIVVPRKSPWISENLLIRCWD